MEANAEVHIYESWVRRKQIDVRNMTPSCQAYCFRVRLVRETEKAVLLDFGKRGGGVWFPKSGVAQIVTDEQARKEEIAYGQAEIDHYKKHEDEMNVRLEEIKKNIPEGYKLCHRCGGTGEYSWNRIDGTVCYGCGGAKYVKIKKMEV